MAVKVTDILTEILTAQGRRTIDAEEAIRLLLIELQRQVQQELLGVAPTDAGFPAWRLRQTLDSINGHLAVFETAAKRELAVAITESWQAGAGMLGEMVIAGGGSFGISGTLLQTMDPWLQNMKQYSWGKVEGLTADLAGKIKGELSLGVLGQKSPFEVAQGIVGSLPKELPTWKNSERTIFSSIEERAQVITQTEMGRAFSMAHQASMDAAADILPGLQKMWLHAGHPKKARIYHLRLNGAIKPVAEAFLVGNIIMMYPRDPKAPASEVIRCGCMHVAYMPEWGKKETFLKSWEKAQTAANKPKGPYKTKEA